MRAPLIQFQSDDRPEIRLQKLRRLAEAVAAIDLTRTTVTPTPSPSSITMTGPAVLGRLSGTGDALSLTGAQVTTILSTFSASNQGVVPAPGTATSNRFLRDDGGWATVTIPPGTLLHADLGGLSADDHAQYVLRSILTTDGDLFTQAAGIVDRVAIGTAAQVLRSAGGAPTWQTVSPVLTLGTDLSGNTTFTDLGNATLNATIVNNAVTDAKLRDSAGLSIIGRSANTTGDPADITGTDGQILRVAGTALGFGSILSTSVSDFNEAAQDAVGNILTDSSRIDFTYSDGGNTITADITLASVDTAYLTNNAVTDTKLRDSAALSVIGRALNSSGDPGDLTASSDGDVLRRSGTTLGFGTVATAGLTDDAVTNVKLANMADSTIKGRASGAGTGDPTDLTAAQVVAIINSTIDHGTLAGLADDDHTQYVLRSILTSNGDLFTRTAGVVARLGIGTSLQILRTVAGAPTWTTLSPVLTLGTDLSGNTTFTDLTSATLNATIVADVVDNTKLANMAQATVKGRAAAAGTGDPTDLTAAQLATIVNTSLDHNTLTNLTTGDPHTQYTANAQAEAIAAAWNFTSRQQVFGTTTANIALVTGLADTGTSIHCVENLKFHRVGAEPFLIVGRINGSYASPTALLNGHSCGGFLWGGYDGTTMASQSGFMEYITSEDWSGTAQGGNLRFQTTIAGTTTRQLRLLLGANSTGAFALLPAGTAAQPGWAFLADTDTGRYSIGANSIGEATGGVLRLTLDTTALTLTLPFRGPNGTAAAPTFSWAGDTNNGGYYIGTDNWGLSANSLLQFELGATYSDMKTQARFTGRQDPTQFTANQNDFAVTTTVSRIYADSDASRDFTGMTGGADGRVIFFFNDGATNAIVVKHESASSTAANRFSLPSGTDSTIQPGGGAGFQYDGTASRWRQFTRLA